MGANFAAMRRAVPTPANPSRERTAGATQHQGADNRLAIRLDRFSFITFPSFRVIGAGV